MLIQCAILQRSSLTVRSLVSKKKRSPALQQDTPYWHQTMAQAMLYTYISCIHDSKQERVTELKMEVDKDGPSTLRLRNCISMTTPIFCNYKQTITMKVTFTQVFTMKALHRLMIPQMVLNLNGAGPTLSSVCTCPTRLKLSMKKQDKNK